MTTSPSSPARYDAVSVTLHWAIAALVIAAYISGEVFVGAPREDKGAIMNWHAGFAVLATLATIARLWWTTRRAAPAEINDNPALARGHRLAVGLLGLLPVALTVTGALTVLSMSRGVPFFGLELIPGFETKDPALHDAMEGPHVLMAKAVFILFWLHAAAAMWHQFVKRDGGLTRMLPFRKA